MNIPDKTVVMYLEPMRNEYWRTYQDVITFSAPPDGPVGKMVKAVRPPKLSSFKTRSAWAPPPGMDCTYSLMRYETKSVKDPI